jgi:dipeptidase D
MDEFIRLGYKPILDKYGNIYVTKPATKGYEKLPVVCIQGHSDMVGDKDPNSKHDFLKDPIQPVVGKDGWIRANKTTLGADNGIGVAMILAIFADRSLNHGKLEALITADEEKGFVGITKFDLPKLKAKYLINADHEDDEQICIGCPGCLYLSASIGYKKESKKRPDTTNLRIRLHKGVGGHSGQAIHEKRINAIKHIFYILSFISNEHDIRLIDIEPSGVADNVIPYECVCNINVLKKDVKKITDIVHLEFKLLKEEYHLEKEIDLSVEKSKTKKPCMTQEDTSKIIGLFAANPNGIVTFN